MGIKWCIYSKKNNIMLKDIEQHTILNELTKEPNINTINKPSDRMSPPRLHSHIHNHYSLT